MMRHLDADLATVMKAADGSFQWDRIPFVLEARRGLGPTLFLKIMILIAYVHFQNSSFLKIRLGRRKMNRYDLKYRNGTMWYTFPY